MSGPGRVSLLLVAAFAASSATTADSPLLPYTVCEIVQDLPAHLDKPVVALGRFSFRQDGKWLGETACDGAPSGAATAPAALWLAEDPTDGPRPPDNFEIDGASLAKKLAEIRKRTTLGKFRFGSTDYDRWAFVFGRVQARKDESHKAAADLVFRGDGVVVFVNQ